MGRRNRRRRRSFLGNVVTIAVIAIIGYQYFMQKNGTTSTPNVSTQQRSVPANISNDIKANHYGIKATKDSWPQLNDKHAVADNLLASNYYIIFDGSGSMNNQGCSGGNDKLTEAKKALGIFSNQLPSNANVGLYIFDKNGKSEKITLAPFNKQQFIATINQSVAGGGTPLKRAIRQGYTALSEQAAKQLGYGEYHLVVVTDGQASEGQSPVSIVSEVLTSSPIIMHTIGFCINDNHSLNQAGLINYRAANDPESLVKGLETVLAESPDFNMDSFSGQ